MVKKLLILLMAYSINTFATPININTADVQTIADSLEGIGLKKAQAIVDYRTKHGTFKSINDLYQISGIGVKTIEKNKKDILLEDPLPEPKQPVITESIEKTI
jgi:competence protein ComEA